MNRSDDRANKAAIFILKLTILIKLIVLIIIIKNPDIIC
jgi:hypothetical protein